MIFNDCSICNGDINLFALYITKTDLSEVRGKGGKISKKVLDAIFTVLSNETIKKFA